MHRSFYLLWVNTKECDCWIPGLRVCSVLSESSKRSSKVAAPFYVPPATVPTVPYPRQHLVFVSVPEFGRSNSCVVVTIYPFFFFFLNYYVQLANGEYAIYS